MAHLSIKKGKSRLRYRIIFPDRTYVDRSRRYKTRQIARGQWPKVAELEEKTKHGVYAHRDIQEWRQRGFLNVQDARRLGFAHSIKNLGQAIEEYRASWEVSPREVQSRASRLLHISEILGPDIPLKNIRHADGLRLKNELKSRGYKVATIQKHVQDLKRLMSLQVANQAIEFNPFADLKGGRIPQSEKIKYVTLTDKQVSEIIQRAEGSEALGGWLKAFLLMFFGSGLRRKEVMGIGWENIDWNERSLTVPASVAKTGKERKIGLGQRLFYDLLLKKKDEGPIFPRFHVDTVSKVIKRHFKACGIKMRLHDTRHTYTSLIQQTAGAKPIEAMARTGHKDMRMLSLYSHGKFGIIYEDRFEFMKMGEEKEGEA